MLDVLSIMQDVMVRVGRSMRVWYCGVSLDSEGRS